MKVYLAGPMTGLPSYGFDRFEAATLQLRALDFEVWSPHERDLELGFDPELGIEEQGFDLRAALDADIAAVLDSELVVVLPGWQGSLGTLAEVVTAEAAGIPVVPYHELVAAAS